MRSATTQMEAHLTTTLPWNFSARPSRLRLCRRTLRIQDQTYPRKLHRGRNPRHLAASQSPRNQPSQDRVLLSRLQLSAPHGCSPYLTQNGTGSRDSVYIHRQRRHHLSKKLLISPRTQLSSRPRTLKRSKSPAGLFFYANQTSRPWALRSQSPSVILREAPLRLLLPFRIQIQSNGSEQQAWS